MVRRVCLIFFLSGVAGLVFEMLWFRQAGLAFGNSVWSSALVLSGFMFGLALGNGVVARYGHRIRRPLFFYAQLEIIISLTGITLVCILPLLGVWLKPIFSFLFEIPWLLNCVRLALTFSLLLIPTTAMGATLPILIKALSPVSSNFGWALGRLYGWNTLGAVAGALCSELIFVKHLGVLGAGFLATLFNLVAAYLALQVEKSTTSVPAEIQEPAAETGGHVPSSPRKRLLGAVFLSGTVLLALEVVWFRFLLLIKVGTSLVFAIMLAIVLCGISAGGLVASRWCRANPGAHVYLRHLAFLSGILTIAVYQFFQSALPLTHAYPQNTLAFSLLAALLILPVSMISGILFTLFGSAARRDSEHATRTAGLLTLTNTLGATLGSFLAGFLLLPKLGMEKSFFLLACAYGIIALLIPRLRSEETVRVKVFSHLMLLTFAVLLLLYPFGLMERVYFRAVSSNFYKYEGAKIVAVKEGLTETIFYLSKEKYGRPYYYRLVTNGFGMAATSIKAQRYMKLYAYWPAALKDDIKNALLISYGMGSTAKALTNIRTIESIDIVDISREVLEMSRIVYPNPEEHPLNDPRVETHIEDGRFFLQTTAKRFDLITGEPPPPKQAGVVNLYSQQYFELVYDRLNEGGIVTYWLPTHLLYEDDSLAILKGFCEVFEDCSLWAGTTLDWMMVGTRGFSGRTADPEIGSLWEDPLVGPELVELGIELPAQMGALFLMDAPMLQKLTYTYLPLTDNYPLRVSTRMKMQAETHSPFHALMVNHTLARQRFRHSSYIKSILPAELREESLQYFDYQRMITAYFEPRFRLPNDYMADNLHQVLSQTSLRTLPFWMLDSSQLEQRIIRELLSEGVSQSGFHHPMAVEAIVNRDYQSALGYIDKVLATSDPKDLLRTYRLQVYLLCLAGQIEEAGTVAGKVVKIFGDNPVNRDYFEWVHNTFPGFPLPESSHDAELDKDSDTVN